MIFSVDSGLTNTSSKVQTHYKSIIHKIYLKIVLPDLQLIQFYVPFQYNFSLKSADVILKHYENKLTKNIRPTDI